MKKIIFVLLAAVSMSATAQLKVNKYHEPIKVEKKWLKYNPGEVIFHDEAPETEGSRFIITSSLIPLLIFRRMHAVCCRLCTMVPRIRISLSLRLLITPW